MCAMAPSNSEICRGATGGFTRMGYSLMTPIVEKHVDRGFVARPRSPTRIDLGIYHNESLHVATVFGQNGSNR